MNELFKYTSESWNEVLTEQGRQLPCSGNSRNITNVYNLPEHNITKKMKLIFYLEEKYREKKYQFQEWENIEDLYRREIAFDFGVDSKVYTAIKRIIKYGFPKKCPAMKHISNLIIF